MCEIIGLGRDGLIYLMVTVAERQTPDTRLQIEIFLALKIIKVTAFAFDDIRQHQRMFVAPEYVIHKVSTFL